MVRSGLEAQLRLSSWPHEERTNKEEELVRQLQSAQRDRSELKGKVDALNDKVNCQRNSKPKVAITITFSSSLENPRPFKF